MRAENLRALDKLQAFDLGWAAGLVWGGAVGATCALLIVMLLGALARG